MFNRIALPANPCRTKQRLRVLTRLAFGLWVVVCLTGEPPNANGSATDDNYYRVYALIDSGDELRDAGKKDRAIAKYTEAQKALKELRLVHPNYNPKLVNSRLLYLANQLEKLSRPPESVDPWTSTNKPTAAKPGGGGKIKVTLLAAGAEPHTELRLQSAPGSVQKVKMVAQMKMGLAEGGADKQMNIPGMILIGTVVTQNSSGPGETAFVVTLSEAAMLEGGDLPPEAVAEAQKVFGGLSGTVVSATMDDRYATLKAAVRPPPGATAEVRKSVEDMRESLAESDIILPKEAVGLGSRWETRHKKKSNGINTEVVMVHELIAVAGNVLTIKSTGKETASPQKISNPLLPSLKVDMTGYTGTSVIHTTLDLARIMPIKATHEQSVEIVMAVNAGKEKQTLTLKTETKATLESL
jgi:hypothetical protein